MSRTVNSFTAQDEIRISDRLTLTAGLRHDHYDDIGGSTTPRLAAVWQAAPGHTIKAQYAEAFRAPTFYEIYNGGEPADIRPETIATSELGYLYKGDIGNGGITLFHSRLDNLISFVDTGEYIGYQNGQGGYSRGVELEGEKWLDSSLKFSGNLTWLDIHDDRTNREITGAGHWLANAGLEYRASQDLSLGLRLRQVGERSREANDTRAPLGGYQVTDISARLFNVAGTKGLTLRAGIRNLFDQDVRYPAMSMQLGIYPDDYPRGSRQWWALMSYSF
jgi:iron complex outermembrane receptor protein